MEFTPEMAERILKTIETAGTSINSTAAEFLNELVNYLIFVESMGAARSVLGIILICIILNITGNLIKVSEDKENIIRIKTLRLFLVSVISVVTLVISWGSYMSLGKILFAPKIYLVEKAVGIVKSQVLPQNK